jgi:DNA invertase Pin-like site-specific DNA recombinase
MAPNSGKFVCYYRVSTGRQGKSGLGLDAQRTAVEAYLNGGDWTIVEEFTEVESGKNSDRPALDQALSAARLHRAALVISKVGRLTRSVAFLSRLLEAGVVTNVHFARADQRVPFSKKGAPLTSTAPPSHERSRWAGCGCTSPGPM